METQLVKSDLPTIDKKEAAVLPSFTDTRSFEHAQRVAKMLSSSDLVPKDYKGNISNCMIALEMSNRIGASPLMVMQNLYIINGRPSWSSSFIIAMLNACGRFSAMKFKKSGEGEQYGFEAYATELKTKELIEGPKVTWEMVKAEGWLAKPGSKWKTMPELMFRYRAASMFGRLYAPDLMMGMLSQEEAQDIEVGSIETIEHEEIKELPEELILVIESTTEAAKLSEIYRNNPEYHNNPDFMVKLNTRKLQIPTNGTAS